MSGTVRPNKQTYEALHRLRGRLQAASAVHISMSATVEYAVRIAFLTLAECDDPDTVVGYPPEMVVSEAVGHKVEGEQGQLVA